MTNTLSELLHDYNGQRELDEFLVDFIAWLGDKDIFFAEQQYRTEDYDIFSWAMISYPEDKIIHKRDGDGKIAVCPDCNTDHYEFLSTDYICIRCRSLADFFTLDPITQEYRGVDADGDEVTWRDPYNEHSYPSVRKPIKDHLKPSFHSVPSMIDHFLRHQRGKDEL